MIAVGKTLGANGLVHGQSGNLSVRAGTRLAVTVAGARLDELRHSDVLILEDSTTVDDRATTELKLHAAVYTARPDVGAIVHTHSPYATAWSCVADQLELSLDEADYYGMLRHVAVAPYARPGSVDLAAYATEALGPGAAVLLRRHGAVAVGPDLLTALCVAESLEHQAHVGWLLRDQERR
jgi:ribulose-5-phosphate 4-epimerase/fuculose-1-phosphate aldolase